MVPILLTIPPLSSAHSLLVIQGCSSGLQFATCQQQLNSPIKQLAPSSWLKKMVHDHSEACHQISYTSPGEVHRARSNIQNTQWQVCHGIPQSEWYCLKGEISALPLDANLQAPPPPGSVRWRKVPKRSLLLWLPPDSTILFWSILSLCHPIYDS